jgi:hypothetical protein
MPNTCRRQLSHSTLPACNAHRRARSQRRFELVELQLLLSQPLQNTAIDPHAFAMRYAYVPGVIDDQRISPERVILIPSTGQQPWQHSFGRMALESFKLRKPGETVDLGARSAAFAAKDFGMARQDLASRFCLGCHTSP